MGYLGRIAILLLIVTVTGSDIGPDGVRNSILLCGVWTVLFTTPLFVAIKDRPAVSPSPRQPLMRAYRDLIGFVTRIHRASPYTIQFLLAFTLSRDGLARVFTYGAVLAKLVFGFGTGGVTVFGVVVNVVTGPATIVFRHPDDRIESKRVILISLGALMELGPYILLLHGRGPMVFWIFGIAMILFVGPAQSTSRSFLVCLIPEGRSGEVFGLYVATGRAVSSLTSSLQMLSLWLGSFLIPAGKSAVHFGILGIMLVLVAGPVVMTLMYEAQQVTHHGWLQPGLTDMERLLGYSFRAVARPRMATRFRQGRKTGIQRLG